MATTPRHLPLLATMDELGTVDPLLRATTEMPLVLLVLLPLLRAIETTTAPLPDHPLAGMAVATTKNQNETESERKSGRKSAKKSEKKSVNVRRKSNVSVRRSANVNERKIASERKNESVRRRKNESVRRRNNARETASAKRTNLARMIRKHPADLQTHLDRHLLLRHQHRQLQQQALLQETKNEIGIDVEQYIVE
jgi:hypothetical protein